jgi:hypothetical protein
MREGREMREMTVKLYQFGELSDAAKERAREWWRECEQREFGGFGELFEPAETAAKLLGIEFATHAVRLIGGTDRQEPRIWWSGFSSQGDGASFEGYYSHRKASTVAVRREFPKDEKLHAIADGLTALQKRHGYKLTAKIKRGYGAGSYVHKYTMDADVYAGDNGADAETAKAVLELMRDFAEWIYRGLEAEYEYRMSDENVADAMEANQYEFTGDGRRA